MDALIVIEEDQGAVAGDDDFGAETADWQTFDTVWADFNPTGGTTFFAAGQKQAKRQGTFAIHRLTGLNTEMRLKYDGDTWAIVRIDRSPRTGMLILYAQARD